MIFHRGLQRFLKRDFLLAFTGIALYAKLTHPQVKIIACQPANDACLYECVKANRILEDFTGTDTFSDGRKFSYSFDFTS